MKRWITQTGTHCDLCEKELPKGSQCFLGDDEIILCDDCADETGENEEGGENFDEHLESIK